MCFAVNGSSLFLNETPILDEYKCMDEIACGTKMFESEKSKSIKLFGLLTAVSLPALGVRDIVLWSSKAAKMVNVSLLNIICRNLSEIIRICRKFSEFIGIFDFF